MKQADTKKLAQALLELTDGNEKDHAKILREFVEYLGKKGLIGQADRIIQEYEGLYNKKHDIVEATVTVLSRLPEKTKLELAETLKKKYKAKEVHLLEKVDQRIIGGLKVKVADTVYDGTIRNTLNQLQVALLK